MSTAGSYGYGGMGGMGMSSYGCGLGSTAPYTQGMHAASSNGAVVPNQDGRQQSKRTFLIGASLEMFVSLCQVLVHSLRSLQEMLSVTVGSYYGIKAIGSLVPYLTGKTEGHKWAATLEGPKSSQVGSAASTAVVSRGGITSIFSKRGVMLGLVVVAIYFLAEKLLQRLTSHVEAESEPLDNEEGEVVAQPAGAPTSAQQRQEEAVETPALQEAPRDQLQNVFVALYDYVACGPNQLSFRQGDQFVIDEYDPSAWCTAITTSVHQPACSEDIAAPPPTVMRGVVPGNFVQRLRIETRM